MTNPTTQPAPTLEETEANLAEMPMSIANILRRRLGLAPAAPEPEPPKAEPPAPPPLDPDPAARAIDPEALQRLDAEIAEKAEREAAEEAKRAEQETAKRAAEQDPAIAAALEPIKARARALSPVKRRLIETAVRVLEPPTEIIYQHSVFCQTVLPYRDPGPEVRTWKRQQGNVCLQVDAGVVGDRKKNDLIPVGLPYGPASRLILCHLNTEALRTQDPIIDVEGSLTAFIRRVTYRPPCGRDFRRFREQLLRLSACNITILYNLESYSAQVNAHIVDAFDLWEEAREGDGQAPKKIVLGPKYFESLLAHAVPLDERAIAALSHSVMALDLYAWLAQRLHRVDPQRGQFIHWPGLHEQFGQGYKNIRQFRADFKTVLTQVLTQYPAARVKLDKTGMQIANSPPPVPSRHAILLPPTKPPKG